MSGKANQNLKENLAKHRRRKKEKLSFNLKKVDRKNHLGRRVALDEGGKRYSSTGNI